MSSSNPDNNPYSSYINSLKFHKGSNVPSPEHSEELREIRKTALSMAEQMCGPIEAEINRLSPNQLANEERLAEDIDRIVDALAHRAPRTENHRPLSSFPNKEIEEASYTLVNAFEFFFVQPDGPIARTYQRLSEIISANILGELNQREVPDNIESLIKEAKTRMFGQVNNLAHALIFLRLTEDPNLVSIDQEWPGLEYLSDEEMLFGLWKKFRKYFAAALTDLLAKKEIQRIYGPKE